jgi:hypothetical protein
MYRGEAPEASDQLYVIASMELGQGQAFCARIARNIVLNGKMAAK